MAVPSITIAVACHKPAPVIKNAVMTPIHAGRALARPEDDPEGVLAAMLGDDTGENISTRNPYFSEMTVTYWAWKNYEKLGNPEYFGLAHYSRILGFAFPHEEGYAFVPDLASVSPAHYAEETITSVVPHYDICARSPVAVIVEDETQDTPVETRCNVVQQYALAHDIGHLELALNLAGRRHPAYREDIEPFLLSESHYLCNLFVMRRDIFLEYAAWIFDILMLVDAALDYSKFSPYQKRTVGFLAERLTGLFFRHMLRRGKTIKHIPGVNIGVA